MPAREQDGARPARLAPTAAGAAIGRCAISDPPAAPERGRPETYDRLAHQARLQLQARTTGRPPVEPLPIEPGRGLCRLPAPCRGDVFLDFEGDPFVGQGGLEYLTGYSYQEADGSIAVPAALRPYLRGRDRLTPGER